MAKYILPEVISLKSDNGEYVKRYTENGLNMVCIEKASIDPYSIFKVAYVDDDKTIFTLQADNGQFLKPFISRNFALITSDNYDPPSSLHYEILELGGDEIAIKSCEFGTFLRRFSNGDDLQYVIPNG